MTHVELDGLPVNLDDLLNTFDDRRSLEARIEDVAPFLVRRFLHTIGSDLLNHESPIEDVQLFRLLNLIVRVNGHEVPRNVALLFFNEDPNRFFEGTRTEVVQFLEEGDILKERIFRGPLDYQIRAALEHLQNLGDSIIRKVPDQIQAEKIVPYPPEALEEALVNAFYHRSYEFPGEPVKVYVYPDRIEVISYPGPVPGIDLRYFQSGEPLPPVPARNRRIGDFLKELNLAERRGTGIPKIQRKMRQIGSPEARFDFDETRTYFRVILPINPRYLEIQAATS